MLSRVDHLWEGGYLLKPLLDPAFAYNLLIFHMVNIATTRMPAVLVLIFRF